MASSEQPSISARRVPGDTALSSRRRRSLKIGDLPDAIDRRYVAERARIGSERRYFDRSGDPRPAIRDRGDQLIAGSNSRATIRDMVDIARHRGWQDVRLAGAEAFRRLAWREAMLAGLDVAGYAPSPAELESLAREQRGRDRSAARRHPDGAPGSDAARMAGARNPLLSGRLRGEGWAPYRDRPGARVSPYVDLEKADGAILRLWGVGLAPALRAVGAELGDRVSLRRAGKEPAKAGQAATASSQPPRLRTRWQVTLEEKAPHRDIDRQRADRFRTLSAQERAADPDLRAAQSHYVIAAAIVGAAIGHQPTALQRLLGKAREAIARRLEAGERLVPARLYSDPGRKSDRARPADEPIARHPDRSRHRGRA